MNWFAYALVTLILWGFATFFPKLSTNYLEPRSAFFFEIIGWTITFPIVFFWLQGRPEVHPKGILFAGLAGLTGSIGTLCFIFAMSQGKASVVTMATALYPLVAITLAWVVLHETVSFQQALGMGFALIALGLFATS